MALIDVVRAKNGTELARFLSSIDARKWASEQVCYCEVTDWGGTVTAHEPGELMRVIVHGEDESFQHVLDSFPCAVDSTAEQVPAQ